MKKYAHIIPKNMKGGITVMKEGNILMEEIKEGGSFTPDAAATGIGCSGLLCGVSCLGLGCGGDALGAVCGVFC